MASLAIPALFEILAEEERIADSKTSSSDFGAEGFKCRVLTL